MSEATDERLVHYLTQGGAFGSRFAARQLIAQFREEIIAEARALTCIVLDDAGSSDGNSSDAEVKPGESFSIGRGRVIVNNGKESVFLGKVIE